MAALALHDALTRIRVNKKPVAPIVLETGAPPPPPAAPVHLATTIQPVYQPVHQPRRRLLVNKYVRDPALDAYTSRSDTELDQPLELLATAATPQLAAEAVGLGLADAVGNVPLSPEETHLLRWFNESNGLAKNAIQTVLEDDPYEWVQMSVNGVAVVEMKQARMQEIGMVFKDGLLPTTEEPALLYWIQDKPPEHKDKFGIWDPISAQWRMHTSRTVQPIEPRIAGKGKGFGTTPAGAVSTETTLISTNDYVDTTPYAGTALEAGLSHVVQALKKLGDGREIPSGSGWGGHGDKVLYYTPQLRHLRIDTSVPEAAGKHYVYVQPDQPIKPMKGAAKWDSTNSCWEYKLDDEGKPRPETECCGASCASCTEREADGVKGV